MSDYVTKDHCATQSAAVLEKLESIERRLFVDNGSPSIQTRLARHEMVIHALLWVVSVAAGTPRYAPGNLAAGGGSAATGALLHVPAYSPISYAPPPG